MPFYKKDTQSVISTDTVAGLGYALSEVNHTSYVYPVDGWYWYANMDAALLGFSAPLVVPGAEFHITNLAFRNRFTTVEKVAMEISALDVPTATTAARQQAAGLRVNIADTAAALFIDLQRADTRAGVQQLEALQLLAVGRAAIILDSPIQTRERPK